MNNIVAYTYLACIGIVVLFAIFMGVRAYITNPILMISLLKTLFQEAIWPLLLKTFAEDFGPENTKRVQEETRRNEARKSKWGHGGERNK
jgi:hypothetical protein